MTNNLPEELAELASEFDTLRSTGNRFPVEVWKAAIALTSKYPVHTVCNAIQVGKQYFCKKIAELTPEVKSPALTFLEIPKPADPLPFNPSSEITVAIKTADGHHLEINGLTSHSVISLVCGIVKKEGSCYR